MHRPHWESVLSVVFLCACFFTIGSFGQDLDDITISGRVIDPNGMAISGVSVTAERQGGAESRTVVTDGTGRYRFVDLPPGEYLLRAAAEGFDPVEPAELRTIAGQNLRLDISLSPATVRATVPAADSELPAVDTERIIVGSTIESEEIEELPNLERNPLDLVLTVGGVSEEALSTSDLAEDADSNPRSTPLEQGNFAISGGASYSNNLTIDGFDNNDDRSARDRFQPSLETVVEVQVVRNQFSAEYGRAAGGRVNLRTRAGTKRFRGRAFIFYRDDIFNANSWYNNSRGIERPPLTSYTPGFTVSGPVLFPFYSGRNRTFFSIAYEHQRFDDTTLIDTFVPVGSNPNYSLPAANGGGEFCDQAGGLPPPATPRRALFHRLPRRSRHPIPAISSLHAWTTNSPRTTTSP